MNWSRFKHDTINNVFGKQKVPTIVGTLATFVYTLVVILVPMGADPSPYLGPAVGGFVAGAVLGTNVYDGLMYGLRAATYGFVLFALTVAIGSFVLFFMATGQTYFYYSSFFGLIVVFGLVPMAGFAGAIAGPIGTLARRFVVPREYNPPVR